VDITEWAHAQIVDVTAVCHWAEVAGAAHGRRLIVLDDGEVIGTPGGTSTPQAVLTAGSAACGGIG
jgi:hypothetical protein